MYYLILITKNVAQKLMNNAYRGVANVKCRSRVCSIKNSRELKIGSCCYFWEEYRINGIFRGVKFSRIGQK